MKSGLHLYPFRNQPRDYSVFSANSGKVHQSISILRQSRIFQAGYTLQNWVCLKKHLNYSLEAPKSISNILKSPEKEEKAVSKYNHCIQKRSSERRCVPSSQTLEGK